MNERDRNEIEAIELLILRALEQLIHVNKSMATAIENLNSSIVNLTASVDDVVTFLGTPHPTDAQVQAGADAVQSQTDRLTKALTDAQSPPPPTP